MKRGSVRDSRISTDSISSINFRNKTLPGISDYKWKEIIDHQDSDLIIYEVREELLKRVLDECYMKFVEKESVKFIVDCAYSAWKQLININFLVHDSAREFCATKSSWVPDPEPETCLPDTWAKGNVALRPRTVEKEPKETAATVLSDYQLVSVDYPTENVFDDGAADSLTAGSEPSSLGQKLRRRKRSASRSPRMSRVETVGPGPATTEEEEEEVSGGDEEAPDEEEAPSPPPPGSRVSESTFTKILRMGKHTLPAITVGGKAMGRGRVLPPWLGCDRAVTQPQRMPLPLPALRLNVRTSVRLPGVRVPPEGLLPPCPHTCEDLTPPPPAASNITF